LKLLLSLELFAAGVTVAIMIIMKFGPDSESESRSLSVGLGDSDSDRRRASVATGRPRAGLPPEPVTARVTQSWWTVPRSDS
jgi:hypothetical protein